MLSTANIAKDFANMQEKMQKISPIKQRILLFADKIGISKREFYSRIGVSRGTLEAKTGITEDVLAKFFATYPEVSIPWVMTGDGNMVKDSIDITPNKASLTTQDVPLYDFDTSTGLTVILNDPNLKPIDHLRIPNLPSVDGALYVRGDSMSPLLKSGDIVMYKKKELSVDSILWGEIYLLSFIYGGDSYTAVKYIRKSNDPDKIQLANFNPDFAPKDIPISSVTALALVKASLTFHTME